MIGFAGEPRREGTRPGEAFRAAPETKTLFAQPKYTFEDLVTNIDNQVAHACTLLSDLTRCGLLLGRRPAAGRSSTAAKGDVPQATRSSALLAAADKSKIGKPGPPDPR